MTVHQKTHVVPSAFALNLNNQQLGSMKQSCYTTELQPHNKQQNGGADGTRTRDKVGF